MPHMHVWWLRFAGPELTKQQKSGASQGSVGCLCVCVELCTLMSQHVAVVVLFFVKDAHFYCSLPPFCARVGVRLT